MMPEIVTCRDFAGAWYVTQYEGRSVKPRRSQYYQTGEEADDVRGWLHMRSLGYPNLKKFEGGANWPSEVREYGPLKLA